MLIPNVSSATQAAPSARPASDGAPGVVVASHANVDAPPSVPVNSSPAPAAKLDAPQQPTPAELKQAIDNINRTLKLSNKNLEFSVDTATKKLLVKLVDTETGDVIREFPTEEALAIARSIDQFQQGLLLKQQA